MCCRRTWLKGGGSVWKPACGVLVCCSLLMFWRASNSAADTASGNYSSLAHPDSSGRLIYAKDIKGNVIPDFSYAGYMGGGVRIPDVGVRITLGPKPAASDDCARIQAAIDAVSKMPADESGFRGAVLLLRGTYNVSKPLLIGASGVVLRGQG